MIEGFDTLKHDMFTYIRDAINNTLIVNYGIILEVHSQKSVQVAVISSTSITSVKLDCTVMQKSGAFFEENIKLEVGDKGVILSLQNFSKDIFTTEEPLLETGRKGYGNLNCVFVPLSTIKESDDTPTKVTIDDEKVLLETSLPVTIESEDAIAITAGKKLTTTSEEETIVEASSVEFMGNTRTLVTHAELKTALDSFKSSITSAITGAISTAIVGHTHICAAPTAPSGPGVGSGTVPPITIDISSSEAKKLKTGAN